MRLRRRWREGRAHGARGGSERRRIAKTFRGLMDADRNMLHFARPSNVRAMLPSTPWQRCSLTPCQFLAAQRIQWPRIGVDTLALGLLSGRDAEPCKHFRKR